MGYFDGSGEQGQNHYLEQVQQAGFHVRETGGWDRWNQMPWKNITHKSAEPNQSYRLGSLCVWYKWGFAVVPRELVKVLGCCGLLWWKWWTRTKSLSWTSSRSCLPSQRDRWVGSVKSKCHGKNNTWLCWIRLILQTRKSLCLVWWGYAVVPRRFINYLHVEQVAFHVRETWRLYQVAFQWEINATLAK